MGTQLVYYFSNGRLKKQDSWLVIMHDCVSKQRKESK